MTVALREDTKEDLPIFFEHQLDAEATRMAAFPSRGRDAFMAHWARIMSNETGILNTILADDTVAGNVVYWEAAGEPNIGYWLGKTHWGKGIASAALGPVLDQDRGATSVCACGKAQFRFDTCLTKMRIPTCARGYVRWR